MRTRVGILVAIFVVLLSLYASSANAATSANYRGWAYASFPQGEQFQTYRATTVPVWKWSATGWTATTWTFGTSFWAVPFGNGWHWAYRSGAWYALRDHSIGNWSCSSPQGRITVTGRRAVHQYNASSSQVLGYIGGNGSYVRLCTNFMDDASSNPNMLRCMAIGCGPDRFVMVRAAVMPSCVFPMGNEPVCSIAMPEGGFPEKVGYVRFSELESMNLR